MSTTTVIRHVHGGAVLGIVGDPKDDTTGKTDPKLHAAEQARHLKALERQGTEVELVDVDADELAAKLKDAGGALDKVRVRNGHVEVDR
jgi:hypothetical protein